MKTLEAGSVELLGPWDFALTDDLLDPVDPTTPAVPVEIAVALDVPADPGDFHAATWIKDTSPAPTTYRLRSTVTFGNTTTTANVKLGEGVFKVYARLTDTPERPLVRLDTLWVKGGTPAAASGGASIIGGTP